MAHSKVLDLGLVISILVGQPTNSSIHTTRASSPLPCLACSSGRVSSPAFMPTPLGITDSLVLLPPAPAAQSRSRACPLLCCSQRASGSPLPFLLSPGPPLPTTTEGYHLKGPGGEGIMPSSMPPHNRQVTEPAVMHSYSWGQFIHIPVTRVSSTVLPRRGSEPLFLTAIAGEKQGQHSCSHDLGASLFHASGSEG